MNHAILAKNLSISYGLNKVIDSASFTVDEQDFVCVVGANGSGKSTLLNLIAEKMHLNRLAPFNKSAIYNYYLEF
mgnify:CR=1 FL=1